MYSAFLRYTYRWMILGRERGRDLQFYQFVTKSKRIWMKDASLGWVFFWGEGGGGGRYTQ